MNERIKELALQAGLEMCSCGCDMPTRQSAKFAELLVKECMEQVWYTREDVINGNVSEVIKERMKQHFGVEE